MIKVFISSPYTLGDQGRNVKIQMDCADELIKMGCSPFIPLLFHFQDMIHPLEYDVWLKLTIDWMEVCDVILRLPGESKGADAEVERAKEMKKRVFYNMEDLNNWLEFTKIRY